MNFRYTLSVLVIFALSLFQGCGPGGLQEGEIIGTVTEVDPGSLTIRISPQNGEGNQNLLFSISNGDAAWLSEGREIRGIELQKEGKTHLGNIFPHSHKEQSLVFSKNHLLRRETDDRGENVYREIGEEIPDFALFDQDGNIITRDSFWGRATVVNFIFTRCKVAEMCPAATMRMGKLLEAVKENSLDRVRLLSITMDPAFDSPGMLKAYAQGYKVDDPQYRFLSGSFQAVHDLKLQLGVDSNPDEEIIISHSMRTILVGPDLKISHQVPGSQWDVEDFLKKIQGSFQPPSSPDANP